MDAMLQLYDDPETLIIDKTDDQLGDKPEESSRSDDKKESKRTIILETSVIMKRLKLTIL